MTILISGNERGLLDSSLLLLDRLDRSCAGEPGGGESIYVNVSSGNLVVQHTDAFLPRGLNRVTYRGQNGALRGAPEPLDEVPIA